MAFDPRLFKSLINNIDNNYIKYQISTDYYVLIPQITLDTPFIFSCFVLSIDGKLCYPNNRSGFAIAKYNKSATPEERQADWWTLNLARSISDAIIIGTNSLRTENGEYLPLITEPILQQSRILNCLAPIPTTIIMCRNLNNIDFNDKIFQLTDYPVIIICDNIDTYNLPFDVQYVMNANTLNKKQILINDSKNLVQLFKKLYQLGYQRILNESPYYHHQLLTEYLLDEFWLNYSLVYIGGTEIATLGQNQNASSKYSVSS